MRQQAAKLYDRFLKGVEGVITPFTSPDAEHIYHVYALRLKDRDRIMTIFKKNQISALVHYPIPLHLQKAYRGLGYKKGDFPVSEKIARQTVSLPMYPYIKEAQVRLVTDIIAKYIKEREIER
jgi:dTDP-4-amino-4,6-dideoxygalactose transaminase